MTHGVTQCPHCGAANPMGSQFCQTCGKALPMTYAPGPRVVGAGEFASTAAGQQLQGDELKKQAKKASGALLVVAIIQSIFPVLFLALANSNRRGAAFDPLVIAIVVGIAGLFWGLWVWSRFQPLPAAIVGLVLYGTLLLINIVTHASQIGSGGGSGIGGLGIGWLDIVIIAMLIQGIQAGVKYRSLVAQQRGY